MEEKKRKRKVVTFRLTHDEYKRLEQIAEEGGYANVSECVRIKALDRSGEDPVLRELLALRRDIKRIAAKLEGR